MMVKAEVVDAFADSLIEFLEEGDIIIEMVETHLAKILLDVVINMKMGIHFVGSGVSGGEGARLAPQ